MGETCLILANSCRLMLSGPSGSTARGGGCRLDYPSTPVGTVGQITVEYATSLGQNGETLAQQLLGVVEPPYTEMESFFGVGGGAVTVIVAPLSGHNDGSAGAYHYGCDFTSGGVLYLDATFANTTIDPTDLELSLYIAELSEAFMGAQGTGWGADRAMARACPGTWPR